MPDSRFRRSVRLVRDAAVEVAEMGLPGGGRFRMVARRLSEALEAAGNRRKLLDVSPYVFESSDIIRTIVEMIDEESGMDEDRLRLARLLLRALEWR